MRTERMCWCKQGAMDDQRGIFTLLVMPGLMCGLPMVSDVMECIWLRRLGMRRLWLL